MSSDGPSEQKAGPSNPESTAVQLSGLKELIKESLTEILRQTPSLLQKPAETDPQRGKRIVYEVEKVNL